MLLELRSLSVFFETAMALNDINLEVDKGEIVGLFGPNGAGKSTLVNIISGLLYPFRAKRELRRGGERISVFGDIIFKNQRINDLYPSKRAELGLATVLERRRIFPEMSVLENILAGAHLVKHKSKIEQNLRFVFQLFPQLEMLKHQKAGFLSGGEQQMLVIARALMTDFELLILDEPMLGLAPIIQQQLLNAIKSINQERGAAILITEQYVLPTINLVDRAYIIERGTINIQGTREELLSKPGLLISYIGA